MIGPTFGLMSQILSKSFHVRKIPTILRHVSMMSTLDDFFVGIGDINSAHLPKLPDPTVTPSSIVMNSTISRLPSSSVSPSSTTVLSPRSGSDLNQPSPDVEAADEAAIATSDATNRVLSRAQSRVIEAVVEERPLARMQEQLDHENDAEEAVGSSPTRKENGEQDKDAISTSENGTDHVSGGAVATKLKSKTRHKMLLHNVDQELSRISAVSNTCLFFPSFTFVLDAHWIMTAQILTEIHRRFYEAYAFAQNGERGRAPAHRDFDVRVREAVTVSPVSGLKALLPILEFHSGY